MTVKQDQDTEQPTAAATEDSQRLCCGGGSMQAYPPQLDDVMPMTSEAHERSIADMLALRRRQGFEDQDIWLFAYGSLIWRPECPAIESLRGHIEGFHRGLYLWSRIHRGTPEQPGLVFGLDEGGGCSGVAFKLSAEDLQCHLLALWKREMPDCSYRPRWVPCALENGCTVPALAFVVARDQPTYAGELPDEIVRKVFDTACGQCGTTYDYVTQTAVALRNAGMPDEALEGLLHRCQPSVNAVS